MVFRLSIINCVAFKMLKRVLEFHRNKKIGGGGMHPPVISCIWHFFCPTQFHQTGDTTGPSINGCCPQIRLACSVIALTHSLPPPQTHTPIACSQLTFSSHRVKSLQPVDKPFVESSSGFMH